MIGDNVSYIEAINRKTNDQMRYKYQRAWDIVEEKRYMELINEFKNRIELSLNKK